MPSITKQSPKGPIKTSRPRGTVSVLDRIDSIPDTPQSLIVSLYGRPKTGKTRTALTFPKPLLVIGTEDGTASVTGTKGADFVKLQACSEISTIIDAIGEGDLLSKWKRDKGNWIKLSNRTGNPYATIVVDNGTKFRDLRITEILGLSEVPVQKGWGFATRDNWMECAQSCKQLWRRMFDLPRQMELNLVMIAQEQNFADESAASSELIVPTIGSALGGSLCNWVNAECDYIGNTYIREQTVAQEVNVGGKKQRINKPTGKKEYCLRVGPHEVYMTGFRLPPGSELVDSIVDPSYEKILNIIKGE